ncbi:progranulin-like isoform X2 [Synchiropus splendidus]|uniref:progranulin-like isoform X2 n=1 Tax=Synchiropus splendidus TaxID=270530 RepID=UPI00237E9EFA|nr:progranulin-like isoform X2 [Synchiropus splendidus]
MVCLDCCTMSLHLSKLFSSVFCLIAGISSVVFYSSNKSFSIQNSPDRANKNLKKPTASVFHYCVYRRFDSAARVCFVLTRKTKKEAPLTMMRFLLWLTLASSVSCNIICPDGSVCSTQATCCRTAHGYSCCPYPNAVCCTDLSHCCPPGFQCNLQAHLCERTGQPWLTIPLTAKVESQNPTRPLLLQDKTVSEAPEAGGGAVIRCDSQFFCPAGSSCCLGSTGRWNCCPYQVGECCPDGEHCCAYGYHCDPSSQSCNKWFSQN